MYWIKYKETENAVEEYLYYPGDNTYSVNNIKVTLSVSDGGCMEMDIYPTNPAYSLIKVRQSTVDVYNDDAVVFSGEIREITTNLNGTKTVYAVGKLAYLKDIVIEPRTYSKTTTRLQMLQRVIQDYNNFLGANKQALTFLAVRGVDWAGKVSENGITTEWGTAYEILDKWFLTPFDLYLKLENGKVVLTTLELYNNQSSTKNIKLGQNLLDYAETIDGNDIITQLYPLGAKDSTGARVDISSVSTGYLKFVADQTAIAKYGYCMQVVTFDGITKPEELKTAAEAELAKLCSENITLNITALELQDLGLGDERFEIGDKVKVICAPFFADREMVITKAEIYPLKPQTNRYTFGIARRTEKLKD